MSTPFEQIEAERQRRLRELAAQGIEERDAPFQETEAAPEVMAQKPPEGEGIPEVIETPPPESPIPPTPTPDPLFGSTLAPEKTAEERIAESEAVLAREEERIQAENLAEQQELARLERLRLEEEARIAAATQPQPEPVPIQQNLFGVTELEPEVEVTKPFTLRPEIQTVEPPPQPTTVPTTQTGQPEEIQIPEELEGTLTGTLLKAGLVAEQEFREIKDKPGTKAEDVLAGILEGAKAGGFQAAAGFVGAVESLGEFVGGKDIPDVPSAVVGSVIKSFEGTTIDPSKPSGLGIDVEFEAKATREAEFLAQNPLFLAGAIIGEIATGAVLGAIIGKALKPVATPIKRVIKRAAITPEEEALLGATKKTPPPKGRQIDDLFREKPKLEKGVIPPEEVPRVTLTDDAPVKNFDDIFGKPPKKEVGAPKDFSEALKDLPPADEVRGLFRITFGKPAPKGKVVKTGKGTVAITKQVSKTAQKQAQKTAQKAQQQFDQIFGTGVKQVPKTKQRQVQTFEQVFKVDVITVPKQTQKQKTQQKQDVIVVTKPITKQEEVLQEITGTKQVVKPVQRQKREVVQVQKQRQTVKQQERQDLKINQVLKTTTTQKQKQKQPTLLKTTITQKQGEKLVQIQKQKTGQQQRQLQKQPQIFKQATVQRQKQAFKFSPLISQKQTTRTLVAPPPKRGQKKKKRRLEKERFGRKRFRNPLAEFEDVLGISNRRTRKQDRRQKVVPQFKF